MGKNGMVKRSVVAVLVAVMVCFGIGIGWQGEKSYSAESGAGELGLLLGAEGTAAQGKSASFTDVKKGDWYCDFVTEMSEVGYLKGYPDGSFRPNQTMSGAEFVTVVTAMAGTPVVENSNGGGSVSVNHWAASQMADALAAGWYDWDEIPPEPSAYDRPISRQVAVKIMINAFDRDATGEYSKWAGQINDFSDLNGRYYNSTFAAYEAGIISGDQNGNFNPLDSLTRAEACSTLNRAGKTFGLKDGANPLPEPLPEPEPVTPAQGGVSENGKLQVIGTQLCNENGAPIVLKGMSSHGIQWFGNFCSEESIRATKDRGANLFRIALYTAENGYISNPSLKEQVVAAADAAIRQDIYVIIDWHILSDGNPNTYLPQAQAFFAEMAERYQNEPAVIFEICNEPNGNVSWSSDIKLYAERILTTIRQYSDAVVLVGSGTWSQDVHQAAADPLAGNNIMYTCHFYAGTHTDWLRNRIDEALAKGAPVFISEWGTSAADGSGGVFLEEAQRWMDFLDQRKISWANWSLCDKQETSAALNPGASPAGGYTDEELSQSGRFVFSKF